MMQISCGIIFYCMILIRLMSFMSAYFQTDAVTVLREHSGNNSSLNNRIYEIGKDLSGLKAENSF